MLRNRKFASLTIPALYLLAGVLWITFSDSILFSLAAAQGWTDHYIQQLAIAKGYVYVGATTWLLFLLIRRAFSTLEASRNDFQRVFSENTNPMWIYDSETLRFMLVNEAACQGYGYTPQEFYTMTLYDIRPAEEYERLRSTVTNRTDGYSKSEKWLHQGKTGSPFYVNIFSNNTIYRGKRCRLVTAVNINQERLAEIERTNLRQALNNSAIVSVTDLKGNILQVNEKFCEVSGYREDELIGRNQSIVNSGYHSNKFWRDMWQSIAKGQTWRGDIRNKNKNGSYYWVDTIINPVYNSDGQIYKLMSVRYVITERKQLENEQQMLLKDLSQYAFQTSHELRGPVARMLGLTSLFKEYPEKTLIIDKVKETALEIDAVIAKMNEALDRNAYPILKKHEAAQTNHLKLSKKAS